MKVFFSDHHLVELPAGHRFPMGKYAALRAALAADPCAADLEFVASEAVDRADLLRVHAESYVSAVERGGLDAASVRRLGFPWSPSLVRRTAASVAGTVRAALAALTEGRAANLAGGTHHAFRDAGSGYCVFNDLAVAAAAVLAQRPAARILIFDCDVHQGDGTAAIFASEPRVFTCSLHGERNFPFHKQESDLDLALADGTTDEPFLAAVAHALTVSLERARPDLILYQAGVDALGSDRLGRLALSHHGLARRDELVFRTAQQRGLPIAWTLGGGYADPIEDSIAAHLGTYRAAARVFATTAESSAARP